MTHLRHEKGLHNSHTCSPLGRRLSWWSLSQSPLGNQQLLCLPPSHTGRLPKSLSQQPRCTQGEGRSSWWTCSVSPQASPTQPPKLALCPTAALCRSAAPLHYCPQGPDRRSPDTRKATESGGANGLQHWENGRRRHRHPPTKLFGTVTAAHSTSVPFCQWRSCVRSTRTRLELGVDAAQQRGPMGSG